MDAYSKIREALELLEWRVLEAERKDKTIVATRRQLDDAFAALSGLERTATEPVAWMWNDMLGIPQVYASQKRPTWPDAGSSPAMAVAINVRPLYATPPPAPVAEMREPTPEECERIITAWWQFRSDKPFDGRAMFDAVRAVMGGKS